MSSKNDYEPGVAMFEKLTELIGRLAENYVLTFLVLLAVGAILLATAATGGWPQLYIAVSEPLWRYVIGVCGVLLLIAAVGFVFLERKIPYRPSATRAGVSIDHPADGISVRVPCPVTGRCKRRPPDSQLRLFIMAGQEKFWPQDEIRVAPDLSWRTELRAAHFKDGEKRRFAIFLVGKDGQALIRHYTVAGEAVRDIEPKDPTRPWPGITALTDDVVQSTDAREVTITH
jgi:hypothetical protein